MFDKAALFSKAWGDNVQHIVLMGSLAITELGGNLTDFYDLMTNETYRLQVVNRLKNPRVREFWSRGYKSISKSSFTSVATKLASLIFDPTLGSCLTARKSNLDVSAVMREGRILLIDLNSGGASKDVTTRIGAVIMRQHNAEAFARTGLPKSQRRQHFLIADEFHRFVSPSCGAEQILAEARKFKLSLISATQDPVQLPERLRKMYMTNSTIKMAFAQGEPQDAAKMAPLFDGANAEQLLRLGVGEAFVRVDQYSTLAKMSPPLEKEEPEMKANSDGEL